MSYIEGIIHARLESETDQEYRLSASYVLHWS